MPACDVLIVGSGAAGLTAAITASAAGLRVIVVEKEAVYGGTTAQSGGFIWIPGNHQAAALGLVDDKDLARQYIAAEASPYFDRPRVDAFLEHGPRMVEFLERESEVRFNVYPHRPDYHPELPGAMTGGRSMAPEAFDGRRLGRHFRALRHPLPQLTFLGMFLGSAGEAEHYFNVTRSFRSFQFVVRQLLGHSLEMLRHGRGARLTRGGALAARLAKSAFDRGVQIECGACAERLLLSADRVSGCVIRRSDGSREDLMANVGVVLASGGFTGDALRKKGLYGRFDRATADHTVACPGNTGDGLRLAEQVGGGLASSISTPAAWMPVSLIPGRSGQEAVFPHLIDRNKPGMIAVNLDGHRFANEASPYHDFVQAMHRSCRSAQGTVAFLICDQRAIDRYGLGFAKPFPVPRFHHIRSGYLFRSRTLSDLARRMEIPPEALMRTVEEFNAHARLGEDPLFGRGRGAYDRSQGDPRNRPNPSLRPLERPPFYAVRLVPADIATFAGIRTDARARVLNASGDAIPGLYAVGADAASIMGGSYPAAGMNLGPAMTFGYIAARDLAQNSGKL